MRLFINPTSVLVSSRIDETVLDKLNPERRSTGSVDGNSWFSSGREPSPGTNHGVGTANGLPALCSARPGSEFSYESAKNKLVNLRLGEADGPRVTFIVPGDVVADEDDGYNNGEAAYAGREGQLLRLSGWVDMDSRLTVGCAGAVISYIQRKRAATFLQGDNAAQAMYRISTVEIFTLRDSM